MKRLTCIAVPVWLAFASTVAAAGGARVETVAQVDAGTGGIELGRDGTVYHSDFGAILGNPSTAGKRVWKIGKDGAPEVLADGFEGASGSAIDSAGNFFQANIRGGYISRIAPDGEVTRFASEGLRAPVGIIIDDADTLFVCNCGSASIQKITKDGTSTRFLDSDLLKCPNGITMDDDGNLYVANFYNGDVIRITPDAKASKLATLPGGNNGHLVFVSGALYVVDRGAHRIVKVSLDGETSVVAGSGEKGGADGPALEAGFCYPNDIAASRDGKTLYVNDVADETSQGFKLAPSRIRRITLD